MNTKTYNIYLFSAYNLVLNTAFTRFYLSLSFNVLDLDLDLDLDYKKDILLNLLLRRINQSVLQEKYSENNDYLEGFAIKENDSHKNGVSFTVLFFDPQHKLPDQEKFEEIISENINMINQAINPEDVAIDFLLKRYSPEIDKDGFKNYPQKNQSSENASLNFEINNICPLCAGNVSFGN
jgi:hypothetical protein